MQDERRIYNDKMHDALSLLFAGPDTPSLRSLRIYSTRHLVCHYTEYLV